MPAPNFENGPMQDPGSAGIERRWTVTLDHGAGRVQQFVTGAVDPAWEGSFLTFRNRAGQILTQFPEAEVIDYRSD